MSRRVVGICWLTLMWLCCPACSDRRQSVAAPAPEDTRGPSRTPDKPPPEPPSGLRLAVAVAVAGDPFRVSLQNRGPEQVRVRAVLRLERRSRSGFAAVPGARLCLSADCPPGSGRADCRALAPGAELGPAPWTPHPGGAGRALPAGEVRLVAEGCSDPPYRLTSEPFSVAEDR